MAPLYLTLSQREALREGHPCQVHNLKRKNVFVFETKQRTSKRQLNTP